MTNSTTPQPTDGAWTDNQDWYTDPLSGSHIVDISTDGNRQLALILKTDGSVRFAAYVDGERTIGDAMGESFVQVVARWSRPAQLGGGVERNYDFDGWTDTPLQLFDEARWSECLHATIQAFNVNNDPAATQAACMDTGLLHELSHLACGVEICTHTSLADLRQRLAALGKGGA